MGRLSQNTYLRRSVGKLGGRPRKRKLSPGDDTNSSIPINEDQSLLKVTSVSDNLGEVSNSEISTGTPPSRQTIWRHKKRAIAQQSIECTPANSLDIMGKLVPFHCNSMI